MSELFSNEQLEELTKNQDTELVEEKKSKQDEKPVVTKTATWDDIFKTSDNVKIIGDEKTIPDELAEVFESAGFGDAGEGYERKTDFRITLKHVGTDGKIGGIIRQYEERHIPSINHVVDTYGAGSYVYLITWREYDPDRAKMVQKRKHWNFEISEKVEASRRSKIKERQIEEKREQMRKLREAKEEERFEREFDALDGAGPGTVQSGREYLMQVVETYKALGLNSGGTNWEKVIATVTPLAIPLLKMVVDGRRADQQRFEQMMLLMMKTKDSAHEQMIGMMQNRGDNSKQFMEAMNMVRNMIEMRDELTEEKEGIVDKLMGMVEQFLPVLKPLLAAPATAGMYKPVINRVREDENVKAAIEDEEIARELTLRLDRFMEANGGDSGQTDTIIENILGRKREELFPAE